MCEQGGEAVGRGVKAEREGTFFMADKTAEITVQAPSIASSVEVFLTYFGEYSDSSALYEKVKPSWAGDADTQAWGRLRCNSGALLASFSPVPHRTHTHIHTHTAMRHREGRHTYDLLPLPSDNCLSTRGTSFEQKREEQKREERNRE